MSNLTTIIVPAGQTRDLFEKFSNSSSPQIQCEIHLEKGARLRHVRIFKDCDSLSHSSNITVVQAENSHYQLHQVNQDTLHLETSTKILLQGTGAECHLFGLDWLRNKQVTSNKTLIDHQAPNCTSTELFKGIFDDESQASFDGTIVVSPGASKTRSSQSNRNLLLSKNATVHTQPHLEIYNDDVKCTHGATVGQLDPDALFYLQARGIDKKTAKAMLTQAFAAEILQGIPE